MTTYEDLVAATLPYGLIPLVVPQLKTITLGGAVTGLGIESASFRNGCPHESVLEMDVLTGDGRVVTATPDGEHSDLFYGFPNSYGTLGYALRLRIELEPVTPYIHLRHLRFDRVADCAEAISRVCADREWDGRGGRLRRRHVVLRDRVLPHARQLRARPRLRHRTTPASRSTTGRSSDAARTGSPPTTTSGAGTPTGSGARGRSAPRTPGSAGCGRSRWRRSDVYWKLIALEDRYRVKRRIDDRNGKPAEERVIQDVEVPVERAGRVHRVPRRANRHRAGLDVPAAPARPRRQMAVVRPRPVDAVRQRRVLVDRSAAARRDRRLPQPRDRGEGQRARWSEVLVFHRVLPRG